MTPTDRLLSATDISQMVGIGRSTLWRMEKAGTFPRRRQITASRVGWLESEVLEWMRNCPIVDPETVTAA